MYKIYQFISIIFAPFINLYLKKRIRLGKEDEIRFKERLGQASISRPDGKLLWMHAASVGETFSVMPLIKVLTEKYPDLNILLTTGTVSSANLVDNKLPDRVFHQYAPVDQYVVVKKFLKHWHPDLAIFVESELWPNLVIKTAEYCKLILINARMSEESFIKWQKYSSIGKKMLDSFSAIYAQSEESANKIRHLGVNAMEMGNLKYASPALPADPKKMGQLIAEIADRPLWVAASTHEGEEEIIAETHKELIVDHPDLLTIIAPRHPSRLDSILSKISNYGNVSVRSRGDKITDKTDFYIADSLGELGIFYRLSSVVLMGGSLVPHGGQNPLEAARLESAIIIGPHMHNFRSIIEEMLNKQAIIRVQNKDELKEELSQLFYDQNKQELLAKEALELVESKNKYLTDYVEKLSKFIDDA